MLKETIKVQASSPEPKKENDRKVNTRIPPTEIGDKDAFLTISKIKNNKGLHISLMDPGDRETDRSQHAVNFWCDVEGDGGAKLEKDPSGGFVFTGNMSSMGNMTLMSAGDGQWNVKTSLEKCNLANEKRVLLVF